MKVLSIAILLSLLSLVGGEARATGSDKIVFVRGGNIWIALPNGTQERQLTFSGQDGSPSLSPDGKWVVYHSGSDKLTGLGQLYLLPAEGGPPKKFDIKGIQAAQDPSFSFDGNSFVFVGISNAKASWLGDLSRTHATMSVATVDLMNMKLRTITSHSNIVLEMGYVYDAPAWSPDQTLVAYQHSGSDVSGGFEIVDLKGKSLFHYPRDAADPSPYWRPRFSPDGTHILCYSPSTSDAAVDTVYLVDIRKGKKRRIADGANPTFVEGGKAIVYEQRSNHWNNHSKPDLWYLKLVPGCIPRKIISNGAQPSD